MSTFISQTLTIIINIYNQKKSINSRRNDKVSIFQQNREKWVTLMIDFYAVMNYKSGLFGFGISNLISRKD